MATVQLPPALHHFESAPAEPSRAASSAALPADNVQLSPPTFRRDMSLFSGLPARRSAPFDEKDESAVLQAITSAYKRLKRSREQDDSIKLEGSDSQEDAQPRCDRVEGEPEENVADDDLHTMMYFLSQARTAQSAPAEPVASSPPRAQSIVYHTLESSGAKHRRHCKVCHKLTVMRCVHCAEVPHLCEGTCALKFHNPKLHIISS